MEACSDVVNLNNIFKSSNPKKSTIFTRGFYASCLSGLQLKKRGRNEPTGLLWDNAALQKDLNSG